MSYLPGLGLLGSIRDDYIPMAPSTAISFIALGYCIYAMSMSAISNLKSNIILFATILILLFGLLELIGFYYGVDLNFEDTIVPAAGKLNNIPVGRMSPSTGAAFFFAGVAIMLLILQYKISKYRIILKHTGGAFGVIIIFTGFTFCLSYLYGTPLLYSQGTIIPMALTTSLAFLLLGFGIIGLAGKSAFPNYYLVGPAISNYLFRYILPLCVFAVVMGGGIVIYSQHIAQINPALAAASLTAIMIFISVIFAILISNHMGDAINKAEDAIRKSEAMKSKMVANIGDVMVIIDKDGINRYKSPNVEKLFGWKPEELIGAPTLKNIHPDDLEVAQKLIYDLLQTPNSTRTAECRYKHKDGKYKFISFTGTNLLHDPDIKGILGNYHDISERKRHEAELINAKNLAEENEIRFKALHNASFGGIAIHDKGLILDCNQGLSNLTGYSTEELIGMDGLLLVAEKSRDLVMSNIMAAYEKPYEAFGVRKNGEEYNLRLEAREIPYRGKNVRVVEFRDVTSRKQAEAELVEAKELAEENDRLKSAFLKNISHEIRTPMNGIMGFTNLMLEAKENKKNEYAMIVQKSSEQLLALVDDVLLISRLQSEKMPTQNVGYSPAELIMDLSQIFSLDDINNKLDIIVNIPDQYKNLTILSDASKIKQVMTNFASNAVKYTHKGSIELGFDIKNEDIEFYVKDTGMGIPKHELEHIFNNFYRGERAILSAIRGTGLGLCIANELVKTLNGKIGVSSEPNHGSRFYFTIPLKKTKKEDKKNDISPQAKQSKLKGLNILIAEDELINYQYVEVILKDKVKRIDHALNGKEAVELASKNCYDVILMDLKMPVMNGLEATQKIKQQFPDLPIIAQTAYINPEDKELALQSGCDGYIGKPFKEDDLLGIINKVIISK